MQRFFVVQFLFFAGWLAVLKDNAGLVSYLRSK